jgi:hypothetical protein
MLWNWLREKVRTACLAGVADAVQELDGAGANEADEAVAVLRLRLGIVHRAGPLAAGDVSTAGGLVPAMPREDGDDTGAAPAGEAAGHAAGNGRRTRR